MCAVSLGTSLAFLSFFTALARSFDVITDPLMGWISDSTESKFGIEGRRRPYMRVYAPLIFDTTCLHRSTGQGNIVEEECKPSGYFLIGICQIYSLLLSALTATLN